MDILVSVGGFPKDVKGEIAVGFALDVDVEHVYEAVDFLLLGPYDVWVKGVYVGEESVSVVGVYGYECIVGLAKPEED